MKKKLAALLTFFPFFHSMAFFDDVYKCEVQKDQSENIISSQLPDQFRGLRVIKFDDVFFMKVSPYKENAIRDISLHQNKRFFDYYIPTLEFFADEYDLNTNSYIKVKKGIASYARFSLIVDQDFFLEEDRSFSIRLQKDSDMGVEPSHFDFVARCSFYD